MRQTISWDNIHRIHIGKIGERIGAGYYNINNKVFFLEGREKSLLNYYNYVVSPSEWCWIDSIRTFDLLTISKNKNYKTRIDKLIDTIKDVDYDVSSMFFNSDTRIKKLYDWYIGFLIYNNMPGEIITPVGSKIKFDADKLNLTQSQIEEGYLNYIYYEKGFKSILKTENVKRKLIDIKFFPRPTEIPKAKLWKPSPNRLPSYVENIEIAKKNGFLPITTYISIKNNNLEIEEINTEEILK